MIGNGSNGNDAGADRRHETHGRPEQILTGESWNPAHNFLYSWKTIQSSVDVESWLEDQDSEAIHYSW